MREIKPEKIEKIVADLCVRANCELRKDVLSALKKAYEREKKSKAGKALKAIIQNASIAKKESLAVCQDTGLPVVFVEAGNNAHIAGDPDKAILKGIRDGYRRGGFRESVVNDPLLRGRSFYRGAVIHTDIVSGDKIKITVMPKGFGCENKSQIKMFLPTAGIKEIKKFIVDAVKDAGPDACPPYVVGVGIGGTADYACLSAKKALLRKIANYKLPITSYLFKLEQSLLREINNLKIGPMGLGGGATCLAVNIESSPTHIAGLPVAVNISCHALRSATAIL